jgi:hypothetical protein
VEEKREVEAGRETYNEYGVMTDSILTVNVVKAENLIPMDFGVSSDPYCVLKIEG